MPSTGWTQRADLVTAGNSSSAGGRSEPRPSARGAHVLETETVDLSSSMDSHHPHHDLPIVKAETPGWVREDESGPLERGGPETGLSRASG
jgi:hypothetical protein